MALPCWPVEAPQCRQKRGRKGGKTSVIPPSIPDTHKDGAPTWAHAAASCKPVGRQACTAGQAVRHEGQGKAGMEWGWHAQRAQRAQAGMRCHVAAGSCRGGQLAVQAELGVLRLPQHHQSNGLHVGGTGRRFASVLMKQIARVRVGVTLIRIQRCSLPLLQHSACLSCPHNPHSPPSTLSTPSRSPAMVTMRWLVGSCAASPDVTRITVPVSAA